MGVPRVTKHTQKFGFGNIDTCIKTPYNLIFAIYILYP